MKTLFQSGGNIRAALLLGSTLFLAGGIAATAGSAEKDTMKEETMMKEKEMMEKEGNMEGQEMMKQDGMMETGEGMKGETMMKEEIEEKME